MTSITRYLAAVAVAASALRDLARLAAAEAPDLPPLHLPVGGAYA